LGATSPSANDRVLLRGFAFAAAVVCVYAMRRVDPDLYGYLTYGRLFLEQGNLTTVDPFAYTSGGARWVTFEYLAHIALWLAYRYLGALGLVVLKGVIGGAAIAGLWAAVRLTARSEAVAVPVFVLSAGLVGRYFLFRPQLFTFAFFALFVLVLLRFVLRRPSPLWVLPLVMLVWANSHGGFVAGLGAIGLALWLQGCANVSSEDVSSTRSLLEGTGPLWLTMLACLVATFVNPQGLYLWGYVLTELTHDTNRRFINEWRPVSLDRDAWSAVGLTIIAAVLPLLTWTATRSQQWVRGPHPVCWALSCVPIIVMAFISVRHVPIAVLWTAPVLALLASVTPAARTPRLVAVFTWLVLWSAASLAIVLTAATLVLRPAPSITADGRVLGATHPCGAVKFLAQNRLTGNVYNTLHWGSYITWELYPSIRVAMDGRNVSLYPRPMVEENLTFYSAGSDTIDLDTPIRYPSDFLLVPADMPALSRVVQDPRWRRIFEDSDSILFVRADSEHQDILAASARGALITPKGACEPFLR
jgi:hypothetical protein